MLKIPKREEHARSYYKLSCFANQSLNKYSFVQLNSKDRKQHKKRWNITPNAKPLWRMPRSLVKLLCASMAPATLTPPKPQQKAQWTPPKKKPSKHMDLNNLTINTKQLDFTKECSSFQKEQRNQCKQQVIEWGFSSRLKKKTTPQKLPQNPSQRKICSARIDLVVQRPLKTNTIPT